MLDTLDLAKINNPTTSTIAQFYAVQSLSNLGEKEVSCIKSKLT